MTWPDELRAITIEAAGDMGLLVALVALRKVENGREGREFGVLSVPAPTYTDQLRVAAISLRHHERRALPPIRDLDGFFTGLFLIDFSHRWAPLDAENDPKGMNATHARNLVQLAGKYADVLRVAISQLG